MLKKIRVLDVVVFATFIALGILLTVRVKRSGGATITVTADGKAYSYSLKKDGTYSVPGAIGETVFEIKNGKVRIVDSPCPGKNCVNQGTALPLVCLPNKVIISADEGEEFDAFAE